jgi:hypothetical protein
MTNLGTIAGGALWSAIALLLAFAALEPVMLDATREATTATVTATAGPAQAA